MPKQPDDIRQLLSQLAIPAADDRAVSQISQLARQNPRRLWKGIAWFRHMRAAIYIPQMRYAIMASMVGVFIAVGMISSPPARRQMLTDEALLFDVDFDEEHWAENLFEPISG